MLPADERRSLNILEELSFFKDNHVKTGLLLKSGVPHLPANQKMPLNHLELLERRYNSKTRICKT